MPSAGARIAVIQLVFALAGAAVIGRAAQLQLFQGDRWAREAERRRTERVVLPARRGALYDRNGVPLAVTQEFFHVGIAPGELGDPARAVRLAARQLGVPRAALERDLRERKRWIYLRGPFTASQVEPLRGVRGFHFEGEQQRFYPARDLARAVIGGLAPDRGGGAAGLELALDSILTGRPGEAVLLKDRAGRRYDSPSRVVREPVPGSDVLLTLDAELQEIAERGLDDALAARDAAGGDVVFLDPATGEILALASRQGDPRGGRRGPSRASALTDPFEPGSTAKLFTAAALLMRGRGDSADVVPVGNGIWHMPVGPGGRVRTITDAHEPRGRSLTLAEAIRVSSNVAMAKFALRLRPEEQFEALRDFGFGSPTGVEFPSESRGRLARPDQWHPMYTRASVAMGYEFGVTPVQLAAAYAAIANDGVLLTPTLVREVRAPDGRTLYRHEPEPVRRAVTPAVAAQLRALLRGAVGEGGTGELGQLANYSLMGKTGTAVRFQDGRYLRGRYTASFAALFPADRPQLALVVKLDDPKGEYYGGRTAAPVTRAMLEQALASRRVAIDRGRLAGGGASARAAPAAGDVPGEPEASTRVVVPWPRGVAAARGGPRPVPDVVGSTAREAALALHRRGFRVSLRGLGRVVRTAPVPGDSLPPGTSVVVWTE